MKNQDNTQKTMTPTTLLSNTEKGEATYVADLIFHLIQQELDNNKGDMVDLKEVHKRVREMLCRT